MKREFALTATSMMLGVPGLAGGGPPGGSEIVYQYRDSVVFPHSDIEHITKAVYAPGEMRLYYQGSSLEDFPVRCFGKTFCDLGSNFQYTIRDGVITIRADFADKISGLSFGNLFNHTVFYRLRYLESPQFAALAEEFSTHFGWVEWKRRGPYYGQDDPRLIRPEEDFRRLFSLLAGARTSRDGRQRYVFSTDAGRTRLTVAALRFSVDRQRWLCYRSMAAVSACEMGGDSSGIRSIFWEELGQVVFSPAEIHLIGGDPSPEAMLVLYDASSHNTTPYDAILIDRVIYLRPKQ